MVYCPVVDLLKKNLILSLHNYINVYHNSFSIYAIL